MRPAPNRLPSVVGAELIFSITRSVAESLRRCLAINGFGPSKNIPRYRSYGDVGQKRPLIHHQKDLPSALQNQVAFGPHCHGKAERLSPSPKAKDRNVSPEPNVDTNSVQGFLGYISYGS